MLNLNEIKKGLKNMGLEAKYNKNIKAWVICGKNYNDYNVGDKEELQKFYDEQILKDMKATLYKLDNLLNCEQKKH